jgi:hypothetical protein
VNTQLKGRRVGSGRGARGFIRRRNTALLSTPCPFRFTLKFDENGFYVSLWGGGGNPFHIGHPKFDPKFVPSQLSSLTNEIKEDVKHALNATVNNGIAREFVVAKFGTFLSTAQINFLNNCAKEDLDEFASLIEMFEKSEKILMNVLWSNKKEGTEDVEVMTTTKITGEVTQDVPLLDGDEKKKLLPVAANATAQRRRIAGSKKLAKLDNAHQVFHCITWAYEDTFRYFLLCPEVIMFDVTSHTNRSGFFLLTFSCKTSIDKQVVFCRVWLPDQRRVSFRYVFQEALPKILPEHARRRVRFILCDGDAQQNIELKYAIYGLFPNAQCGGCSYHMFVVGWNRHVISPSRYSNKGKKDAWNGFHRRILSWMFSWVRPGCCNNREEYEISKYILLACLTSKHALKMAGDNEYIIESAVQFLRKYVFPNEPSYLHYLRKDVFCLDQFCTSAQEGTNNSLKSGASGARATHTLDKAATAITNQDRTRSAVLDGMVGNDFRNRKKHWSTSPTSTFLLSHAEALMQSMYRRATQYRVRRIGDNIFQVVFVGKGSDDDFIRRYIDDWEPNHKMPAPPTGNECHDDHQDEDNILDDEKHHEDIFTKCCWPQFSHAYTVDLNSTCTTCDCSHFLRAGFPCPHMAACANAVSDASGVIFNGFKHDSVAARWWTDFMYYAYRIVDTKEEEDIVKLFHYLAQKDVEGPKFHGDMPSSLRLPIKEKVEDLPAMERISNYPKDVLTSLFDGFEHKFDGLLSTTSTSSSSQYMDDIGNDDQDYFLSTIEDLRHESGEVFERMLDDSHKEQMYLFEIEAALKEGASYRSALYPLFNEFTDLLQQLNTPEAGKNVEKILKDMIDNLHQQLAEKQARKQHAKKMKTSTTSPPSPPTDTSPDNTSPATSAIAGVKRNSRWQSATSLRHDGPGRVMVSKNGKY